MSIRLRWFGWVLLLGLRPCLAQTPTDTITRRLNAQLQRLQVSPLTRLVQVREALAQDLRLDRNAQLPGLLLYLTTQLPLPDSIERLRPYELWALQAAAGDFSAALRTITQTPQAPRWQWQLPPTLPPTNLFDLTAAYVARHADSLARAARAAQLPAEDSAFTQINIGLLANGRRPVPEELNEQLRGFLWRYPASAYTYVMRRFVRYEAVPSAFTLGLLGGGGPTFFRGDIGKFFGSDGLFSVGAEGSWQRWQLTLNLRGGGTYARTAYQFNGTAWPTDLYLSYAMTEVLAGYRVLDAGRLRLTPFAGLATFSISPETKYHQVAPDLNRTLRFAQPFTAGIMADLKFGLHAGTTRQERNDGGGFVRLRGGWRALTATAAPFSAGHLFYAEAGVGFFFRLPEHYKK